MTIDRSWLENFKTNTPDAFDTNAPSDIKTIFIDGQLKLQCPQTITAWDTWFDCLYRKCIQRYLDMPGVTTVVMGFDDHTHSPLAKGPTQMKRRSRSEVPTWEELRPLPPCIPSNYDKLLFNRNFKGRVIRFVIEQIKLQCRTKSAQQRIIIDYQGLPYVAVGKGAGHAAGAVCEKGEAEPTTEFSVSCLLGECDVKFVRYLAWGDMILDAVDSDYVIIGMCQHERLGHASPRIFVRRLLLLPSNAAIAAADSAQGNATTKTQAKKTKKRSLNQSAFFTCGIGTQEDTTMAPPEEEVPVDLALEKTQSVNAKKAGRKYEYVDCGKVVEGVRLTFGKLTSQALRPYTVRILAHCISLCGCDFTRGVSWFNGTTACRNAALLWPALCKAATVDATTGALVMNPRVVAEGVIGKLWKDVQFKKFCGGVDMQTAHFETLFNNISTNEKISLFRRTRLITPTQLSCLVRNCNWTVFYWTDPENCPCAVNGGDFGYKQKKTSPKVHFDDETPLPPIAPVASPSFRWNNP